MNEIDRHDPIGCPDAEMLAAWSEGGLRIDERSRIEEHAAACGRCQAHLAALTRTAGTGPNEVSPRAKTFRLWPWLVPTAGAAAAVTVWIIVQSPPAVQGPREEAPQVQAREEADRAAAAPAPEAERRESRQAASSRVDRAPERKLEALAKDRRDRPASNEAPPASAPAAPPPVAAQETVPMSSMARVGDAAAIGNLVVQRSPEGRITWETQREGIYAQLTAGASPSPDVIWLVGKRGLVLLSIDGRSWRRLPFPDAVDLTGVDASSDRAATVTTADARVFTTSDGGASWHRR